MVERLSKRQRIAATALVAVLALVLTAPAPAQTEASGADYEQDALDLCPGGDLQCVEETVSELESHTQALIQDCDHNAIFATLYTIVTQHYYATVADNPDFFGDTAFVNREDRVFAHYYFGAYRNWVDGYRSLPYLPPAWREAFAAAANREVSAAGNMLLGVNAHVVRDLPFALAGIGMGSKQDHDKVNDILREAYGPALAGINDHLADTIDQANLDGTQLDDDVLFQTIASWREQAWRDAEALLNASSESERQAVAAEIEQKAAAQARTFRRQYAYPPGSPRPDERAAYCEANAWPANWLR